MNPSTFDYFLERVRLLKSRIAPDRHESAMCCAILEDICLALKQMNAEMEMSRLPEDERTKGTKRALLNFTERKRR